MSLCLALHQGIHTLNSFTAWFAYESEVEGIYYCSELANHGKTFSTVIKNDIPGGRKMWASGGSEITTTRTTGVLTIHLGYHQLEVSPQARVAGRGPSTRRSLIFDDAHTLHSETRSCQGNTRISIAAVNVFFKKLESMTSDIQTVRKVSEFVTSEFKQSENCLNL